MSRREAKGWDEIWQRWSGVWEGRPPEQAVIDLAGRLKAEGRRRVHDLGCGPGRHLLYLAAEGFETTGSDVSPAAVETSRRHLREAGLSAPVTLADMTDLPAEDGSLDAVIAWDVVYHGTLETMRRTATIKTATKCRFYEIKKDDFLNLAETDHEPGFRILLNLARIVSARLRKADEDTIKLTTALSIILRES